LSSTTYHHWDEETIAVPRDEWLAFCEERAIVYVPNQIGRNGFVHYLSDEGWRGPQVSIIYGEADYSDLPKLPNGMPDFGAAQPPERAYTIYVSVPWMSEGQDKVAEIGLEIWRRWGGTLTADPEIREIIAAHAIFA
jgi:hypothetical protein